MEKPRPRELAFHKETSGRSEFTVLDKAAYIDQLHQLIPQAQRRVWLQTMTFDGNGPFVDLKNLVVDSATRGVDTRYTVDAYHKLLVAGRPYYLPGIKPSTKQKLREKTGERKAALDEFEQNNVLVTVTNPPSTLKERVNPARGRNHIKMAIIDDVAFVGDLHNFVSKDQPGIMIKVTDPLLVKGLSDVFTSAAKGRGGSDYEITGSKDTKLLIDTGVNHQSLILDRATALADQAESSIRMHTQHTPDGKVLDALQKAQDRGLAVSVAIADPQLVLRPLSRLFDARSQLKLKRAGYTFPILEISRWVHSNILLIDQALPSAQAIVGTRCFSDTLADWGTNEVALQSENADLLQQLTAHTHNVESLGTPRDHNRTVKQIVFRR